MAGSHILVVFVHCYPAYFRYIRSVCMYIRVDARKQEHCTDMSCLRLAPVPRAVLVSTPPEIKVPWQKNHPLPIGATRQQLSLISSVQVLSLAELCPALAPVRTESPRSFHAYYSPAYDPTSHHRAPSPTHSHIQTCEADTSCLPRQLVLLPAYCWLGPYAGFRPESRSSLVLQLRAPVAMAHCVVRGGKITVPAGVHAEVSGKLSFEDVEFQGVNPPF
jgi:hypothetical protein